MTACHAQAIDQQPESFAFPRRGRALLPLKILAVDLKALDEGSRGRQDQHGLGDEGAGDGVAVLAARRSAQISLKPDGVENDDQFFEL
ncbi:MAG TPA: hypothetical protein VK446_16080 [Methylocystis sp.]|nr:hypothetical protein [Methylocystis sp.]